MDSIVSFGSYSFDMENQISSNDNFASAQVQVIRLPGVDGGYSTYGDDAGPAPVGKVDFSFWIHATPATMTAVKDAVRELSSIGYQTLLMQPSGYIGNVNRSCYAAVRDIRMRSSLKDRSQENQRVDMVFVVPVPVWQSSTINTDTRPITSAALNFSLGNLGNIETPPKFTITVTSGSNFLIERVVSSDVVDFIRVNRTFAASDSLVIDCAHLSVELNGAGAYNDQFTSLEPRWFRFAKGTNLIRVSGVEGMLTTDWRTQYK